MDLLGIRGAALDFHQGAIRVGRESINARIILCGADAKLGFKEIEYGIIPGFGGTQRLPRRIGKSKAKELIFTGAVIAADEALQIRLVNRVYPVEQLRGAALELLATICSNGLLSLKLAKEQPRTAILVNLSGRGDKDVDFVMDNYEKKYF